MKGHLKIELKDVNSGEVEKHEQDNMVTEAMANLLGLTAISSGISNSSNTKLLYYLIPIAQKGLGGIFLFDGTLEERKDNIHFPMDVHLTGCAGRSANTSSKLIGSYNSVESHRNDNGFTSVWDFGTSQANGTIASLSLTNYLFGEKPFSAIYQSGDSLGSVGSGYVPIAYDANNEMVYLYSYGKIYSKKMYSSTIHVNSPDFTDKVEAFNFNFTNPSYSGWTVCNGYDGYIYAIYCPVATSKKSVTFKIRKIKVSDFSFTDEGEESISIDNITCPATSGTNYSLKMAHCVSRGFLYFYSYDNYILYKVNLSNTVDVKEFTFGDGITIRSIYPLYNGGVYVSNVYFYGYSSSGSKTRYRATGWVTPDGKLTYNELSTNDSSYDNDTYYYCNFEGDNLFVVQNNNSDTFCYAMARNYLGTICNLASPVTKTSAQTMKITYTLTDA